MKRDNSAWACEMHLLSPVAISACVNCRNKYYRELYKKNENFRDSRRRGFKKWASKPENRRGINLRYHEWMLKNKFKIPQLVETGLLIYRLKQKEKDERSRDND